MTAQTLPVIKISTKPQKAFPGSYVELEKRVRARFALAQNVIENERVRAYWDVGKLIDRHIIGHGERAHYGKSVIEKLARKVGVSNELLYKMRQFARDFPILSTSTKLTWSHYVTLLSLNDEAKRKSLLARIERFGWPVERLEEEVKKLNHAGRASTVHPIAGTGKKTIPTLAVPKLGSFYTCKIIRPKNFPDLLRIDLGFENCIDLDRAGIKNVKEGEILLTDGISKILRRSTVEDLLYTYKAYIEKVVDGDTLRLNVDLGFGIWNRRYLRLRGIDTPELSTKAGKAAKAFVERRLSGQPVITLRTTTQTDIHNRYIADIFYGENIHLNQLLLEKGFASKMY